MVSSVLEPALIPFTTSNDELPPPLVDICRQNLEDVIVALEDIHAKIAILKQDLEALFNRQKEAALAKKACQGLLSPLRKVPNEIIAQVIQASFGNPSCLDAKDLRIFWTFRRVCRRWRGVGFSTPVFWRGLHLGPTQISERNLSQKMATWFNRSGIHSPLALTVVQAVPQAAIGDILLDKNRHWVHLNLQVGSPFLNRLCHRLSTQDAAQCWSHARVLELGHSPFGPEYHLSSNFFNSIMAKRHYFPALRRLSLTRMAFITSSDTLSHATLSSLCLSVCLVGFPTIRSILDPRKLPSLQELSLVNVTFLLSEEAGQYSPLPHAGIRRLVMRGTSASVFLPMLNLPNLEFATFRSDSRSREHDVVSFLKRSGATLRGICFEGCGVSPAWISSMLWDLPKVEFVSAPSFEVFESWALLDARVLPTFKTFVCNGQVLNPTPQSIAATVSYVEKRGNLTEDPLIIQITARTSLENRDVFRSLEEHPGVQFQRVSQQDLCRDPFA